MKRPGSKISVLLLLPFLGLALSADVAAIGQQAKPAAQDNPQPTGFTFPDDAAGKELAQKLPPGAQTRLPALPPVKKLHARVPASVKNPLVLQPVPVSVPRLPPVPPSARAQPAPVPEEIPLTYYAGSPPLPEANKVEVGPPVSVPSVDVNQPPVLVQVKQPAPEPLNLADPTQEASHQAALGGTPPPRTEAAPFLRLTLPDPFANRKDAGAAEMPPEEAVPVTATPAVPGR